MFHESQNKVHFRTSPFLFWLVLRSWIIYLPACFSTQVSVLLLKYTKRMLLPTLCETDFFLLTGELLTKGSYTTLPWHWPPIHAVKTADSKRGNDDAFSKLRKSENPKFLNWVAPGSSWAICLFTAQPHSRERKRGGVRAAIRNQSSCCPKMG